MSTERNIIRVDGADKVSGKTGFIGDIKLDDLWHGAIVRAPESCGKIKSLEFNEQFDWSSVCVVTAADIPGENTVNMIEPDLPCLADVSVNYLGEPVVLVAGPSRKLALEACRNISVQMESHPALAGLGDLIKKYKDAPESIHSLKTIELTDGELTAARNRADRIISSEYILSAQEHAYLEPQGVIAYPFDANGNLHILGSMQCPYYIRPAVARLLGVQEDSVHVEQAPTGGAFGGKEDFPSILACHAALLANCSGHPVRILFDREEDIAYTTKRHPAWVRLTTGVLSDGSLTSFEAEILFDGGAYVTLSPVVLSRGVLHACGVYRFDAVHIHAVAARTNMPPAGAFRGFGAPQVLTALECHIDDIASELGISPLSLRQKNLLRSGDRMATGQVLQESVGIDDCLQSVVGRSGYPLQPAARDVIKKKNRHLKRGMGVSTFLHGAGFTGSGEKHISAKAGLRLHSDGSVVILASNTEMGQGLQTVLPQIVAKALSLPQKLVSYPLPNTANVPDSGPTVASRSTMIVGRVLELASQKLVDDLIAKLPEGTRFETGAFKQASGDLIRWQDASKILAEKTPHYVEAEYDFPKDQEWDEASYKGIAYPVYAWGAAVVETLVDPDTLEIFVPDIWLAYDIGHAVNPTLARGQLEGGSLQALGYGLCEEMTVANGRYEQDRFQTYIIPTAADAPIMHLEIVEKPYGRGPGGAKGLGELPMNGVAAALRNAVRDATGLSINEFPLTPEKLFAAKHEVRKDD